MANSKEATVANAANQIRDGVSEFKDATKNKAADVYENVSDKAQELHKQGGKLIERNPYTSVLVAFGIGTVLGVLIARK